MGGRAGCCGTYGGYGGLSGLSVDPGDIMYGGEYPNWNMIIQV